MIRPERRAQVAFVIRDDQQIADGGRESIGDELQDVTHARS